MFGGIAFRAKCGAEPIEIIEIGAPPLDLQGALRRAPRIDGGIWRVGGFIIPISHPFIEIPG
jgi:hypothetical protein